MGPFPSYPLIGERERANLVVRKARFFRYIYIYILITGAAYVVSNSMLHAHAHAHVKLQSTACIGNNSMQAGSSSSWTASCQVAGAGALQSQLVKARKLTPYVFLFCTCSLCMYMSFVCYCVQRLAFKTAQERVQLASNLRRR